MKKFDTNDFINCFKMIVDLEGIKKLEEYIKNLEQENNRLKKQYCERTDCSGRLGNSRKVERLIQENEELHNKIDKAIEYNKQIIKDTKGFYRPTSDTIYSGDCLIDIAELNLKILKDSYVDEDKSNT